MLVVYVSMCGGEGGGGSRDEKGIPATNDSIKND